jgi:hypothetical protein
VLGGAVLVLAGVVLVVLVELGVEVVLEITTGGA